MVWTIEIRSSHFWRIEVHDLGLPLATFLLCPHMPCGTSLLSLCLNLSFSQVHKTNWNESTLLLSFHPNQLFKNLISKYSHMLQYQGLLCVPHVSWDGSQLRPWHSQHINSPALFGHQFFLLPSHLISCSLWWKTFFLTEVCNCCFPLPFSLHSAVYFHCDMKTMPVVENSDNLMMNPVIIQSFLVLIFMI